jgi:hypothetical protein
MNDLQVFHDFRKKNSNLEVFEPLAQNTKSKTLMMANAKRQGEKYPVVTIVSENIIRVRWYDHAPINGKKDIPEESEWEWLKKKKLQEIKDYVEEGDSCPLREEKIKKDNTYNKNRSKSKFIDLVNANFDYRDKFITLTFKDGVTVGRGDKKRLIDNKSIESTNQAMDVFLKRMRRKYPDMKFIYVIEFQDKNDRGAVHYHMICNLPYIPNKELNKLWGFGHVRINAIDSSKEYKENEVRYTEDGHVDNVGLYMSKYMVKDLEDTRLKGYRSWRCSQNMNRPERLSGELAYGFIELMGLKEKNPASSATYPTEFQGICNQLEYNLERNK